MLQRRHALSPAVSRETLVRTGRIMTSISTRRIEPVTDTATLDAALLQTREAGVAQPSTRALDVPDEGVALADMSLEIKGYASTFEPPERADCYHEIIEPGAFQASLDRHAELLASEGRLLVKVLDEHWHGQGAPIEMREDETGLWTHSQLAHIQRALDTIALARIGVKDGLSIGFYPLRFEVDETILDDWGWPLVIHKEVDLVEYSTVMFPANPYARITEVRSAAGEVLPFAHFDAIRERRSSFGLYDPSWGALMPKPPTSVRGVRLDAAFPTLAVRAGRKLSQASIDALNDATDNISSGVDKIRGLVASAEETDAAPAPSGAKADPPPADPVPAEPPKPEASPATLDALASLSAALDQTLAIGVATASPSEGSTTGDVG